MNVFEFAKCARSYVSVAYRGRISISGVLVVIICVFLISTCLLVNYLAFLLGNEFLSRVTMIVVFASMALLFYAMIAMHNIWDESIRRNLQLNLSRISCGDIFTLRRLYLEKLIGGSEGYVSMLDNYSKVKEYISRGYVFRYGGVGPDGQGLMLAISFFVPVILSMISLYASLTNNSFPAFVGGFEYVWDNKFDLFLVFSGFLYALFVSFLFFRGVLKVLFYTLDKFLERLFPSHVSRRSMRVFLSDMAVMASLH
jgi:hypothetical protein